MLECLRGDMGEVLALLDAGRGGEDDCTPPRWESIELA